VLLGDEESDLAILQIEGARRPMPALPLRDSDTVEVGELVLAIGNPFGVGQTVSAASSRGWRAPGPTGNARGYFIQTDAPINPGQLGRRAGGCERRADRDQHRDPDALGRLQRDRLCHSRRQRWWRRFVRQARAGETRFRGPGRA
jgi:hypothetical protein